MRKLIVFGLALTGLALIMRCKKFEISPDYTHSHDLTEKFFSSSSNIPSSIIRIAETIRKQNREHHFLLKFIEEQGLASWEHSMIFTGNNLGTNTRRDGGIKDTLVFIPLVQDHAAFAHGFLACVVGPDSVKIRLFDGSTYSTYGYIKGLDSLSAASIAATTMYMHHRMFGDTSFRVLDTLLFKKPGYTGKKRRVIFNDSTSGRLTIIPMGTECVPVSWEDDYVRLNIGIFDLCWDVEYWIDIVDPILPGGTTIPSGGGSSGGWWNQDPCRLAEAINGPGTCGGGGGPGFGWEALPIEFPISTEPIDTLLIRYSRAIKNMAIDVYDNQSQPANIEHAFTGIEQNGQYVTNYLTTNNDSLFVIPKVMIGREVLRFVWHSHVSQSANPADRRSFSTDDINLLRHPRCLTQNFVSFADCRNKRYALVITNVDSAKAFFDSHDLNSIDSLYTTTGGGNMQEVDERCVKNVIGSNATNGIVFYVSTDAPDFQTWTLLNP